MTATKKNDNKGDSTITDVEREALIDLVNALVKNQFLRPTTNTNEYEITGILVSTTKTRLKHEDDFLAEYKKLRHIVGRFVNLYTIYSGDNTFSRIFLFDDANFKESLDRILNYSATREVISSLFLDSYKSTWDDIYKVLAQNIQNKYKREEVEAHTKNITAASAHVLNNFIVLIKNIISYQKLGVNIEQLDMGELGHKLGIKSWLSSNNMPKERIIPTQTLLIKSGADRMEKRQLLIVQDVPSQVIEEIAQLITTNRIPNFYALVLKINKPLIADTIEVPERQKDLTPLSIDTFRDIDRFRIRWSNKLLQMEIPTKYQFDDAIDSVMFIVSVLFLQSKIVKVLLEEALAIRGNSNESISLYNKALQLDPYNAEPVYLKGISLAEASKFEEAIACFDEAIELVPMNANLYYHKARALYESGKYEQAIKFYEKATGIDYNHVDAWMGQGNALSKLGRNDQAIDRFNKAIEIEPQSYGAWNNKGLVYGKLKKYEDAINCYNKALELNPNYVDACYNKGRSLCNLTIYMHSTICFDYVIGIDPNHVDALIYKAWIFANTDRNEEALSIIEKSLQIKPDNPEALCTKGFIKYNLGLPEDSLEYYEKALELEPTYAEAWSNKGLSFYHLGKSNDATECFDKAIELAPDNANLYYNRGKAILNIGNDYRGAIQYFDKVLSITPEHVHAWYYRAIADIKNASIETGLNDLDKVFEIISKHHYDYDIEYYRNLAKRTKFNDAVGGFEKILTIIKEYPHDIEYYRNLAKKDKDFEDIKNNERFKIIIEPLTPELQHYLEDEREVINYSSGLEPKYLGDYYISQRAILASIETTVLDDEDLEKKYSHDIRDLSSIINQYLHEDKDRRLIISAPFGAGKSSASRILASKLAAEFLLYGSRMSGTGHYIPILVDLKNGLNNVYAQYDLSEILDNIIAPDNQRRRPNILVILDGLQEYHDDFHVVMEHIEDVNKKYPNMKVIITVRSWIELYVNVNNYVRLLPFTEEQVDEFFKKSGAPTTYDDAVRLGVQREELSKPLYVWMFAMMNIVTDVKRQLASEQSLSAKMSLIYMTFFHHVVGGKYKSNISAHDWYELYISEKIILRRIPVLERLFANNLTIGGIINSLHSDPEVKIPDDIMTSSITPYMNIHYGPEGKVLSFFSHTMSDYLLAEYYIEGLLNADISRLGTKMPSQNTIEFLHGLIELLSTQNIDVREYMTKQVDLLKSFRYKGEQNQALAQLIDSSFKCFLMDSIESSDDLFVHERAKNIMKIKSMPSDNGNMLLFVHKWISLNILSQLKTRLYPEKSKIVELINVSSRFMPRYIINLTNIDLSGADLSGCDLSRAKMSGADLSGCDLSRAKMSGANLSGSLFTRSIVSRADLSNADLSNADLSNADLSNADLSYTNLSGADLSGAKMSGAILDNAVLPTGYKQHNSDD